MVTYAKLSELGRGQTEETGKRNFRELLSVRVEHMLLNGAVQIEETATQLAERPRNSTSGNGACQSSHNCVAVWFPSVSCSIMRVSNSFIS
jgi:hypothetical protein